MIILTISGPLPRHVHPQQLQRILESIFLLARRKSRGSVGLRFVSEAEIKKLNTMYRRRPRATDVLSFSPAYLPGTSRSGKNVEWGDIVIATNYAAKEARRRSVSLSEEIFRLTAHGMLHLLGYDHVTDEQESRMFTLQEKAVGGILH